MRTKLQNLQQKLSHGMIGRKDVIKTALLAMLAGENVLLIGPPGTGKSMVARRVSEALLGENRYFEYLLTKFSTPEELFGPLSISELKNDRFKRNTAGYLPTVQIAFLDEIFKASSSILNSLLTILNERKFHNGTESQSVPLQAVIAASNELPKGQAELSALYDRFLLRRFVDYLDHNKLGELFNLPEAEDLFANECLSPRDLTTLRQQAKEVAFPEEIRQAVQTIWQKHQELFKENADEQLSDRRFVKAVKLMRMSAASNGRTEVDLSDVMLLKDCLWNDEANAEKVLKLIRKTLKEFAVNEKNKLVKSPSKFTRIPYTDSIPKKIKNVNVKVGDIISGELEILAFEGGFGKIFTHEGSFRGVFTQYIPPSSFSIKFDEPVTVRYVNVEAGQVISQDGIIMTVERKNKQENTPVKLLLEQLKNNIWLS